MLLPFSSLLGRKDMRDERVVFVPSLQLLNLMTGIYKTWYVWLPLGGHSNAILVMR
jgi:hypothetical protein